MWTGNTAGSYNYGRMWYERHVFAHRFSWMIHFGEIPKGMRVCHKCDVTICVNPDHLFLGTDADNMHDRDAKGRSCKGENHWQNKYPERRMVGCLNGTHTKPESVARGIRAGLAKLDDEKVMEIRKLYSTTRISQDSLASKYGVGQSTISSIVLGRTWTHVK